MLKASPICDYHKILKGFCTDFYIVYMEQKLSGLQSGSQSRRCTCCSIQQSMSYCCSLFSHCYIVIQLISGLKSRS